MRDTDALKDFLQSDESMLLITNEVGERKTPLLTKAITLSNPDHMVFRLKGRPNTQPAALANLLSKHWAVQFDANQTSISEKLSAAINCLNTHKQSCLLLVEQAHLLPMAVLNTLCHLSHAQTNKPAVVRIILAGYPEFISKINAFHFKNFASPRVIYIKNNAIAPITPQRLLPIIAITLCLTGFLWWKIQGSVVLFHVHSSTPNAHHKRIHTA